MLEGNSMHRPIRHISMLFTVVHRITSNDCIIDYTSQNSFTFTLVTDVQGLMSSGICFINQNLDSMKFSVYVFFPIL